METMRAATKGPICITCIKRRPNSPSHYSWDQRRDAIVREETRQAEASATDRLFADTTRLTVRKSELRTVCCTRQVAALRYSADFISCIRHMNSGSPNAWRDSARRPRLKCW